MKPQNIINDISEALIPDSQEDPIPDSQEAISPYEASEDPIPYKPLPTNIWDPRLILDLAIGIDDLEVVLRNYNLSEKEFEALTALPAFKRELADTMRDVRDKGVTFTAKARVQAESYLETLDDLIYNVATPAGVKLDAIKSVVKWGALEPQENKDSAGVGQSVNIQINF